MNEKNREHNHAANVIPSRILIFILILLFYKLFGFKIAIFFALAHIATSVSIMEQRSRGAD